MRTIPELRKILAENSGGPILLSAAKDLLAHVDRLHAVAVRYRSVAIAERMLSELCTRKEAAEWIDRKAA